jgi:cell division control protein 6
MPGDATSLYISGSPGCGKTALVNSVIATAVLDENKVKVLSVNCMALKSIDALWERLVDAFGGVKTKARSKAKGHALVELTLKGLKTKW